MNLKELVVNIKEKRRVINLKKVDSDNPHVTRNVAAQKRRAQEDLKELFNDYRNVIGTSALFMIVSGSKSKDFVDIATGEKFGCFACSANEFYDKIMSDISPRLYMGKSCNSTIFDIVSTNFAEMALDLDIISFPALVFERKWSKVIKDREQLRDVVSQAFNQKVGSEVVALFAIDKVAKQGFEQEFDGKFLPIIMEVSEELLENIATDFKKITPNVYVIKAGELKGQSYKTLMTSCSETVDESEIKKILTQIKKSAK